MENGTTIETQKSESSRIYSLYYSFFLIPFMIAIFGGVFFLLFNFITYETKDPSELLNQVKIGSATKRWQSAFELSKVLNDADRVPTDLSFKNQMISAYQHSINDDPLVRSYLAIAMGVSRDSFYEKELLNGLEDENRESRLAAVQAIGMVGSNKSLTKLEKIIKTSDYQDERLAATMSLGFIGNSNSIPVLTELLDDNEPNIRWDAAVGLAKMGSEACLPVLSNLLDREYLMTFPELNFEKISKVMMVAIEASSNFKNPVFESKLKELSKSDENLKIRNAAIKILEKTYDQVI
jgi:HEAT repeat protein|tara:strand:+ start:67 stop:948 length:882 start_codon:yes stop_codon:yes gene_type:complete